MKVEFSHSINKGLVSVDFRKGNNNFDRSIFQMLDLRSDVKLPPAWYSIAGPAYIVEKVYRDMQDCAPSIVYRTSYTCVHKWRWTTLVAKRLEKRKSFKHLTRKEFADGLR